MYLLTQSQRQKIYSLCDSIPSSSTRIFYHLYLFSRQRYNTSMYTQQTNSWHTFTQSRYPLYQLLYLNPMLITILFLNQRFAFSSSEKFKCILWTLSSLQTVLRICMCVNIYSSVLFFSSQSVFFSFQITLHETSMSTKTGIELILRSIRPTKPVLLRLVFPKKLLEWISFKFVGDLSSSTSSSSHIAPLLCVVQSIE